MKRPAFTHTFYAAFAILFIVAGCAAKRVTTWTTSDQPSAEIEQLRKQIKAPVFADREFLITDFGAVAGGETKNTEAFRKAIEACNKGGGGRVVVPDGVFLTGAIHLKSNVNLHLSDKATILFSRDSSDYLPMVFTRWEGMELMNYSPFIYAYGQKNIAITGNGTLDGNADNEHWWYWCGAKKYGWKEGLGRQNPARALLHDLNHEQKDPKKRLFGPGHFLRPNFVQPYNCKNVLISGIKMVNSPMWNLNPVLCENVIVENVKVISHGPNNDGCDPESCKNVLIKDCYFDTGDDCIAIKSGRDEDGRRIGRPAENHIIEGCTMKDGHGGVVIGSEISGGARNIYSFNCIMDSPDLDRVLRIKTSSSRGGIIENVFMKDVKVGTYREAAVKCNMFYEKPGNFIPTIRNVWVENLEVEQGGTYGLLVSAYRESPVENLRMINCNIKGVKVPYKVDYVKGLKMENVVINGERMVLPDSIK
ncbi:glycoside hydrolase family 28 protein [Pararcticibacter amylolyticus]|uniref:Glycoside hydrolase n=1 Tax=Pararcticibacter amylolyticus TaxID=2173175 RepID=A0A2U2PD39_9SPHI|nr:glycoside hydrolase family 28 protein [Pararcticibacter amylolyticus]PWG79039.1 glycoside hydrolase [Pararcticibacter amylolyticus]